MKLTGLEFTSLCILTPDQFKPHMGMWVYVYMCLYMWECVMCRCICLCACSCVVSMYVCVSVFTEGLTFLCSRLRQLSVDFCSLQRIYGQRFMTLYKRQGARPSPKKKKGKKSKMALWGGLTNSCEKKKSKKQQRKGKIYPFECRVAKNSEER